jgi:hypothetical protein
MEENSPYLPEVDIRGIARSILQLSPIVLVFIYVFEYTYAFQFLVQFGVTPEEVGISQIKLLTRAALLTFFVVSVFGSIVAIVAFSFTLNSWASDSARTGLLYTMRRSIEKSNNALARQFNRIARRAGPERKSMQNRSKLKTARANLPKQPYVLRIAGTVSFAVIMALIIALAGGLGLTSRGLIIFLIVDVILSSALATGWGRANIRQQVLAFGAAVSIILLGLAAYFGGAHQGIDAATTGRAPSLAIALGIDLVQVHPTWINQSVMPRQYKQGQDLIELGSDGATAFLYDCSQAATYRIPLDDIVLTYPLLYNQTNSATLHRLHCG